jgi:two-component system sensor histidine kinase/response regulator
VLARLESQQERLEALVADRTHQLQQLLSHAEAGQRAKAAFLSKMSHEIRTPLNAILGFAHLLQREVRDPVQSDRLRKMEQAGRHLLTLLTDILDLARIEADRVDLHVARLDLAAVTQRVQAMVADAAAAKGLKLVASPVPPMPAWLCGDAPRITQCLLNLTFNAVKFTERGQVEIHTRMVHEDHDTAVLRFDVDDTGPGIPPDQAERLFALFEQGPARALNPQGSGLGLAITRGLARAMGGDSGMEPRPDGGQPVLVHDRPGAPQRCRCGDLIRCSGPAARVAARQAGRGE